MKIINPSIHIETEIDGIELLKRIERAGRTAYKSENSITDDSCIKFISKIIKAGHESVLEHQSISVRVICDRGVSHEIVRHRIASYTQESTRYCNYSNNKFGNEVTYINPCFWEKGSEQYKIWKEMLLAIEKQYLKLIQLGAPPQEARSILPNSLKTEIVITMNIREWRYFLNLRTASNSHPQMQQVSKMILKEFKEKLPVLFNDIFLADNLL